MAPGITYVVERRRLRSYLASPPAGGSSHTGYLHSAPDAVACIGGEYMGHLPACCLSGYA
jgi:hypothetical protein